MITSRRAFMGIAGLSSVALAPLIRTAAAQIPKVESPVHPPLAVRPKPPMKKRAVVKKVKTAAPLRHKTAEDLRAEYTLSTQGNRHFLALTMWGEARGYGEDGMRCVGHVILNRVKANNRLLGQGIRGVCKKRRQFSCWNAGDPNRARMKKLAHLDLSHPDWQAFVAADKLAARLLAGLEPDNTDGSTFYCVKSMRPPWAKDMNKSCTMFGHTFYKPKPPHKHKKHHRRPRHDKGN